MTTSPTDRPRAAGLPDLESLALRGFVGSAGGETRTPTGRPPGSSSRARARITVDLRVVYANEVVVVVVADDDQAREIAAR